MNRRIPNGTYGGVRGRGLAAPSYSIGVFETYFTFIALYSLVIAITAFSVGVRSPLEPEA